MRLAKWGLVGLLVPLLALVSSGTAFSGRARPAILLWVGGFVVWILLGPMLAGRLDEPRLAGSLPWLVCGGIALVAYRCVGAAGPAFVPPMLSWLVSCGGLAALLVLAPKFGFTYGPTLPRLEGGGSFGNPNWAAAFLAPLVPIALGLRRDKPPLIDATFVGLAVLLSAAVFSTGSRAGAAALCCGVLVFFLAAREPVRAWVPFGIATVAAGTSAILIAIAGAGTLPPGSGFAARAFYWHHALQVIIENPLIGAGPGMVFSGLPTTAQNILAAIPGAIVPFGPFEFAYHDLLQVSAEFGLPGGALLVALTTATLGTALTSPARHVRALGASFVVLTFHGLVDSPLHLPSSAVLWWLIVGLVMWTEDPHEASNQFLESLVRITRFRWKAAVLALSLIGFLEGVRDMAGIFLWNQAEEALSRNQPEEAETALQGASAFLPEYRGIHLRRAGILAKLGRLDEAANEFERTLQCGFSWEALFARAAIIEMRDGPEHSRKEWDSLAKAFPGIARIQYELARLAWDSGDMEGARLHVSRCLSIHRGWPDEAWVKARAMELDVRLSHLPGKVSVPGAPRTR